MYYSIVIKFIDYLNSEFSLNNSFYYSIKADDGKNVLGWQFSIVGINPTSGKASRKGGADALFSHISA